MFNYAYCVLFINVYSVVISILMVDRTIMTALNETHSPALISWVDAANEPETDFPIQNLPFAIFRRNGSSESFRGGVAIGDQIVDLLKAKETGLFDGQALSGIEACCGDSLNAFMALGKECWSALRLRLSQLLRNELAEEMKQLLVGCLVPQNEVEYSLPCRIGDYTDFYTSIHHATTVGSLFRPDNPLLPNYKWVPIGYHGRASSIVVSGSDFSRPVGQTKPVDADTPVLGPCTRLDYELELGVYMGVGNKLGAPIDIDSAEDHAFGVSLLNDWSARDIQAWEYQPLGPFLSKNFISSVSPWIVTMEALAPFRASWTRDAEDPQPLAYLDSDSVREAGAIDIKLEVYLQTERMREASSSAVQLAESNFIQSYWTLSQMIAHHTVTGCNLRTGDFLGTGTQSGASEGETGSMLELSLGGKKPFSLPNGEQRTFLADGDKVILKGWCNSSSARRIGFGEVSGTVIP